MEQDIVAAEDDDFGDLYADVELEASSAINIAPQINSVLDVIEDNDIDEEDDDDDDDSEDDLDIVLNSDGDGDSVRPGGDVATKPSPIFAFFLSLHDPPDLPVSFTAFLFSLLYDKVSPDVEPAWPVHGTNPCKLHGWLLPSCDSKIHSPTSPFHYMDKIPPPTEP
ncbi:hypothetical protein Tco_0180583 [Tanacetum coccineum]